MDGYCSITVANHGLSRLIRFVSWFTAHPCKKFCKYHLVLQISKIYSQNFAFLCFCVYRVWTKQGLNSDWKAPIQIARAHFPNMHMTIRAKEQTKHHLQWKHTKIGRRSHSLNHYWCEQTEGPVASSGSGRAAHQRSNPGLGVRWCHTRGPGCVHVYRCVCVRV